MIVSFADKATAAIIKGEYARRIPVDIQAKAQKKLEAIHAAIDITDLRIPPGNHLEKLKGDREGQYSIRINQQWRICFIWFNGNAKNVEIVDYH
ncbi:type II toxin-antitoxin system RelE/ParE family toxin [Psychrobacter jeotgali]|uniref:type II toxin-antitoxin system RelE/ParE family toxin n=1 Tax=Psychrobacter jeotgali TaxID=179010 RepID=UPI001918E086|nr:type II toxin-antitoxin system RelE/ParE family toxin [Psychrobacter jeotgali]